MNKQKIMIWGRALELDIMFDCYEGEQVLPIQEDALKRILENPSVLDDCKAAVEAYCIARNADDIASERIDNIFKYVMPKSLYIQRTNDNSRILGLMCAYKFNDDGIVAVFKNEQLEQVGSQNVIL